MRKKTIALVLGSSLLLVAVDQFLKLWVLRSMRGTAASVTLIPGLLQLTYVENRGAAFGMFQGWVGALSVVTLLVVAGAVILLCMGKFKEKPVLVSVALIIAGGAGNLVDRVARGFVVDYLDISPLFSFPVFNFADCCVVAGTFLLMIYLLFFEERALRRKAKIAKEEAPQQPGDGEDLLG